MSERVETHDFMSVDSFSQLPFLRPPTTKPSSSSSNSSSTSNNIRLFGFDLPPDRNPSPEEEEEEEGANATAVPTTATTSVAAPAAAPGSEQSGRKFECHYCCRNFPTSQALGGHQNAHKRERQHAKRAHLHSAMAAAHHHHHHPQPAEGHLYGILNYHRLGSLPSAAAARFGLDPPPHYPSWSSGGGGPRFHAGLGSASQPINGSPLPLWRVPGGAVGMVVHRDSGAAAAALPNLLAGGGIESMPPPPPPLRRMGMGMGSSYYNASSSTSSSSSSSPSLLHDSVSLDLHL